MFWKKIAPVHRPPGVCCPSAGCCVPLLFNVATVTVRFISLGAPGLLGCIFYAWNATPRKRGGGAAGFEGGGHRVQGAADLQVDACELTLLCVSSQETWYSNWSRRVWAETFAPGQKQMMSVTARVKMHCRLWHLLSQSHVRLLSTDSCCIFICRVSAVLTKL